MLKKAVIWSPVEEFSLPSPFIFLPQDFSALLRLLFISPGTPVRPRYDPGTTPVRPPQTRTKPLQTLAWHGGTTPVRPKKPAAGGKNLFVAYRVFSWPSHPRLSAAFRGFPRLSAPKKSEAISTYLDLSRP